MTVRGKIKRGKVLLDDPKALADCTVVEVRPIRKPRAAKPPATQPKPARKKPGNRANRFANFIGKAVGLPPDAAANHDYYLYGAPKRE